MKTHSSQTITTLHTLPAALFAVAFILTSSLMPALSQSNDFDDMMDTDWTHYDPLGDATGVPQNSWTFVNGGYRLQAAPTPNPLAGPGRVASLRQDIPYTDFYVAVDITDWNNSYIQAMGILARVQATPPPGLGTTAGYVFGIVTGPTPFIQISIITSEATDDIPGSSPAAITLDPARDYRLEFVGKGSEFTGRVYELPDLGSPLATVTATDITYTGGICGLVAFSLNGDVAEAVDVTYDNYRGLTAEPPRLSIEFNVLGEANVTWPSDAGPFILQSTDDLTPPVVWTDVPADQIFDNGPQKLYIDGAPVGTRIFRLFQD